MSCEVVLESFIGYGQVEATSYSFGEGYSSFSY